jgi:NSS family neurotransmitter:Na+ symporter
MPMPQITGTVFFLFLLLAALTTLIAVIENLAAFLIDEFALPRRLSAIIAGVAVTVLSVPCALGFGVLKFIQPLGKGSCILDLEDFIVSQNLLPLGALFAWYFCLSKRGWGWKNFLAETDCGTGMRFPVKAYIYIKYILPVLIVAVFAAGYIQQFDLVNKIISLLK